MRGNVIQTAFDDFMKSLGFSKKSGSWYRTSDDVVSVVELQRSQYGPWYYVNLAAWLRALGEEKAPKEHKCHMRTRLDNLVGAGEARLTSLLDLEVAMPDAERRSMLTEFLREHLRPALDAMSSLEALHAPEGQKMVALSVVTGPARQLLKV
uniref:DUF4304 domain-containing protein n=1 Tax=Arthrobacter rhombi TaxID=71253 RepID=G8DC59_9MICC|nr:DUF4304 domain-containing protein [Arthrobacter rhombi]AER68059.1 hypothetical protein [Arthrobacter rhombi]